ncbi:hypothetical protein [Neptuniibacter sp. QD37_11]|uniref:hypothetical protein n=1 Tax=Neptuniibacter sp. QD37_11 TaxID=3398209 RepID=UPI0039F475B7
MCQSENCNGNRFIASQRVYLDVVVDNQGNFVRNLYNESYGDAEFGAPYGPFSCTKCGRETSDQDAVPSFCPDCLNTEFYGRQSGTVSVYVDETGRYVDHASGDEQAGASIYDTDKIEGPYVCDACSAEYESLT